jgi:hypothetical protein
MRSAGASLVRHGHASWTRADRTSTIDLRQTFFWRVRKRASTEQANRRQTLPHRQASQLALCVAARCHCLFRCHLRIALGLLAPAAGSGLAAVHGPARPPPRPPPAVLRQRRRLRPRCTSPPPAAHCRAGPGGQPGGSGGASSCGGSTQERPVELAHESQGEGHTRGPNRP